MHGVVPTAGKLVPVPVAWAPSSNYLAIPYGRLLRIYRVTSGNPPEYCATTAPHDGIITSVQGIAGMQFVTSSEDATVRFWDALDGHCIRTIDFAQTIRAVAVVEDSLICLTASEVVLEYTSPKPKARITILDQISTDALSRVAVSSNASVIVYTKKNKLCVTFGLKKPHQTIDVTFPNSLTAIAVSSNGFFIAAGDVNGKIYLVEDIISKVPIKFERSRITFSKLLPSVFHWHASAVSSLCFAHNNTILVSGGKEGVLTSWSITPTSLGSRTFLPRLRAPVVALSVSSDESTYAISHSDNTITLLEQASGNVSSTIRTINTPVRQKYNAHLVTCPAPKATALYIASGDDRIQLFDPVRGEHLDEFTVTARNDVFNQADENTKNSADVSRVTLIAAHSNGILLSTIDVTRRTIGVCGRVKKENSTALRIWDREGPNSSWNLSAVIYNPHGEYHEITSVTFHPELSVLVTTGSDNTIRFWRAVAKQQHRGSQLTWRCELSRDYRGMTCLCTTFSSDGSLLAAGFENVVTLWEVEDIGYDSEGNQIEAIDFASSCSLNVKFVQALVHAPLFDTVQSIKYCMCGVALFAAVTPRGIYLWNAVSHGIWWSFGVRCIPSSLTVDEQSGRFAIVVYVSGIVANSSKGEDVLVRRGYEKSTDDGIVRNQNPSDTEQTPLSEEQGNRKVSKSGNEKCASEMGGAMDINALYETDEKASTAERIDASESKDPHSHVAVAVFDPKSPVPIKVSRFPFGVSVRSLRFVPVMDNKNCKSVLMCIDSNFEVSIIKTSSDDVDEFSLISDVGLNAKNITDGGSNKVRNLDAMLGDHWQTEIARIGFDSAAAVADFGHSDVEKLLNKYFPGPIHTQAPPHVQTLNFLDDVFNLELSRSKESDAPRRPISAKNDETGQMFEKIENPQQPEGDFAEKSLDAQDVSLDEDDIVDEELNFEAMQKICKQIIADIGAG